MSTEDWKRVITEARALGVLQLGLSGGEPLVRKDTEELAAHARGLGLYSTLVTSGFGLTRTRAEKFREAGLEHIQISLQDADDDNGRADRRRAIGEAKRAAAALVRDSGSPFPFNVVLHKANLDRIQQDHRPGRGEWAPTGSSWPTRSTMAGDWSTATRSCRRASRWIGAFEVAERGQAGPTAAACRSSSSSPTTTRSTRSRATVAGARCTSS